MKLKTKLEFLNIGTLSKTLHMVLDTHILLKHKSVILKFVQGGEYLVKYKEK